MYSNYDVTPKVRKTTFKSHLNPSWRNLHLYSHKNWYTSFRQLQVVMYSKYDVTAKKKENVLINKIYVPGIVLRFNYLKRLTRFSAFKC